MVEAGLHRDRLRSHCAFVALDSGLSKLCFGSSSQNKFIGLFPNTETYRNSYLSKTVKDCKGLPCEIGSIESAKQFKKSLSEHFNYCH